MKITKSTLKQLIKEELEALEELGYSPYLEKELEKARVASPERQLAVYKAKTHLARRGMADNHRRIVKLRRELRVAEEMVAADLQTPDFKRINELASRIWEESEALHNIMLELKNM
jgi:hypothetical protein